MSMLNHNVSVISVSQLNLYLKSIFDSNPVLNNLLVKGEISNLKYYPSGHIYFSLKDDEGVVKCVMFSTYASKLKETLKEGEKVIINGSVSIYGVNGTYQFYVKALEKEGLGNLYLQFEQLKKELSNEGLFDEHHKLPLPAYPMSIGIISGKTAAGLADIISIIKRRWPIASVVVFPCLVQGKEAPTSIIAALEEAKKHDLEVTILARGGGSQEDLWCFNDKSLAYAIYNYPKPIISGIGHEIDFTIADFVADVRAPTPSGAAELATPNIDEVLKSISLSKKIIVNRAKQVVNEKRNILMDCEAFLTKETFYKMLNNKKQMLLDKKVELKSNYFQFSYIHKKEIKENYDKLKMEYEHYLARAKDEVLFETRLLDNISPLKVLQRGYSVVTNAEGIVNSVDKVNIDDVIRITMSDGRIYACVTRKDDKNGK